MQARHNILPDLDHETGHVFSFEFAANEETLFEFFNGFVQSRRRVGKRSLNFSQLGSSADICDDIAWKKFELAFDELLESFFVLDFGKAIIEAVNAANYRRQEMSNNWVHA